METALIKAASAAEARTKLARAERDCGSGEQLVLASAHDSDLEERERHRAARSGRRRGAASTGARESLRKTLRQWACLHRPFHSVSDARCSRDLPPGPSRV
ncbi:hypothetical protein AMYX_14060 [Anaeromyxobacter diazotrophicus]|uniref:Uncharacterized protein n=1 Tax=Anaeromyxobacter diazotrophicus TaxID=2590199 RepID=A0A7I9VJX1_9BACT|nr:hypothetical protein AMYX_14060 [Anaeromyxobacter diazotrophicus]